MIYFFLFKNKKAAFILILLLFQSCTTLPQAEFYEIDGVLTIDSHRLAYFQSWDHVEQNSTVSLISTPDTLGYVEPLSFPFYIQNPGTYTFWFLGNSASEGFDAGNVSISLMDEQGDQYYQTLIKNDFNPLLRWRNLDYDDQPVTFLIHRPGHYRVTIRPLGLDRFIINKIHMTLDNHHPPQGVGLPSTLNPKLDPLLQKREQRVDLPPSWVLGPIYGGYSKNSGRDVSEEMLLRSGIAADEMRNWEKSTDYGQFKIKDLGKNIELMANPRVITYELPYASYDVGGFSYNEAPPFNEELLIRWSQFSAFNSVMHLFSTKIYDTLIDENRLSEESYRHINELIHLRHRLFPYIYSEFYLARGTGIKPIRGSSDNSTQYMFGDSFLAAPMYSIGEDERFVNLPSGIWYDYFNGTRYDGGQSWLVEAPLYKIPLFVKAGSIIPYRTEGEPVYFAHFDSLLIEIYGGSVGSFRLYEDDGLSTLYKQGAFSTTAFRYFERDDYATFTIGRVVREMDGQSMEKVMKLIFKQLQKPISVLANEVELGEGNEMSEWYYDDEEGQMILNWIQPNNIKTDIEIKF